MSKTYQKIYNPQTKRYVDVTSQTGQKVLSNYMNGGSSRSPSPRRSSSRRSSRSPSPRRSSSRRSPRRRRTTLSVQRANDMNRPSKLKEGSPPAKLLAYDHIACSKFKSQDACTKFVLESANKLENDKNIVITNIILSSVQTWLSSGKKGAAAATGAVVGTGAALGAYAGSAIIAAETAAGATTAATLSGAAGAAVAEAAIATGVVAEGTIGLTGTAAALGTTGSTLGAGVGAAAASGAAIAAGLYVLSGYSTQCTMFHRKRKASEERKKQLKVKTVHSSFFNYNYGKYMKNVVNEANTLTANGHEIICVAPDNYKTGVTGRSVWYSAIFYR